MSTTAPKLPYPPAVHKIVMQALFNAMVCTIMAINERLNKKGL